MIMYESGYYPAGAEYDPSSPWNRSNPDERIRDVDYSCTLHLAVPVSTTEYTPGEVETDDEGYTFQGEDDFSDTDWLEEFSSQYRTPAQLIALLRDIASEFVAGRVPQKRKSQWQHIADDCRGWEVDDESAEEI